MMTLHFTGRYRDLRLALWPEIGVEVREFKGVVVEVGREDEIAAKDELSHEGGKGHLYDFED